MSKQTAFLLPPAPDDRIYIADFYFVPGRRARLGYLGTSSALGPELMILFLAAAA
jgi:hypothetical protein